MPPQRIKRFSGWLGGLSIINKSQQGQVRQLANPTAGPAWEKPIVGLDPAGLGDGDDCLVDNGVVCVSYFLAHIYSAIRLGNVLMSIGLAI